MAGGQVLQRIEDYLEQQDYDDDFTTGSNKKKKTAFGSSATIAGPTWYRTAYHITGTGSGNWNGTVPDYSVRAKAQASLEFNLVNGQVNAVTLKGGGYPTTTMTYADIVRIARAIDDLYVGPSYRILLLPDPITGNVAIDPRFTKLYGVKPLTLATKYGNAPGTATVNCMACYYCGLYLPINLLEIDHWYEQTHGQMGAVIKVLRTINRNLTNGDATGKRASVYFQFGGISEVPNRNPGPTLTDGRINLLRRNVQADTKQSLNYRGLLFFSLAYGAFYEMHRGNDFFRHFVHSLVNLAPVCGACNKLKNQRGFSKRL